MVTRFETFLLVWLPLEVHLSVSVQMEYTLFTSMSYTWNEAKLKCENIGSRLATIDTRTKLRTLEYLKSRSPWNKSLVDGHYWMGLHISEEGVGCSSDTRMFWSDCESLYTWANWGRFEPDKCDIEGCISVDSTFKWKTSECDAMFGILCEKVIPGETCFFEEQLLESFADTNRIKLKLNVSSWECEKFCLESILDGDRQCWFFQNTSQVSDGDCFCSLFFKYDGYRVNNGKGTSGTMFYVKRCGQAVLSDDFPSSSEIIGGREAQSSCPVNAGDCYFETIGMADLLGVSDLVKGTLDFVGSDEECKNYCMDRYNTLNSRSCWFVDTFSPLTKACRLYFLRDDLPDTFRISDPSTRMKTLFVRRCLKEDVTTTLAAITTTLMEDFEELRVKKTVTAKYKRLFISVYDNRPSAVSMGIIGSLFLSTIVCFVIISDIPILWKHAKTVGARNVRRRNRCFPPKTKKKSKTLKIIHTNEEEQIE